MSELEKLVEKANKQEANITFKPGDIVEQYDSTSYKWFGKFEIIKKLDRNDPEIINSYLRTISKELDIYKIKALFNYPGDKVSITTSNKLRIYNK